MHFSRDVASPPASSVPNGADEYRHPRATRPVSRRPLRDTAGIGGRRHGHRVPRRRSEASARRGHQGAAPGPRRGAGWRTLVRTRRNQGGALCSVLPSRISSGRPKLFRYYNLRNHVFWRMRDPCEACDNCRSRAVYRDDLMCSQVTGLSPPAK